LVPYQQFPLDAYSSGDAQNYIGWWNHKSLPKFNIDNPKVREYILVWRVSGSSRVRMLEAGCAE